MSSVLAWSWSGLGMVMPLHWHGKRESGRKSRAGGEAGGTVLALY